MTNAFERDSRKIRLQTLVRLRWLAVAGQTVTILIVLEWLEFDLPAVACFAIIGLSAVLNIVLTLRFPVSHRLSRLEATGYLTYDVLQLSGLLALTGGLTNPFAFLIVVPVLISAGILPATNTIGLGFVVATASTVLALWHLPLPWGGVGGFTPPPLYVIGVWTAIVSAVAFMGFYAWRIAEEARLLADALVATELVLAREQHLSEIDGLAAAAAHELGTPLATIALVTKELARDLPTHEPWREDVELLRTEVERCRQILRKIGSLGERPDGYFDRLPLSSLVEDLAAPHRDFGIDIRVGISGSGVEPVTHRNPAILYGLGNFLENAIDFARSTAWLSAEWTEDEVWVRISDDGPGFSAEVLDRLGEPYVTHKSPRARRVRGPDAAGLGLGVFIAKTLLERSGAVVTLQNGMIPKAGADVWVTWPRATFEHAHDPVLETTRKSRKMGRIDTPAGSAEDFSDAEARLSKTTDGAIS